MIDNLYNIFSNLTFKSIAITSFLILPYSIFVFWFIFYIFYNAITWLGYKIRLNKKNMQVFFRKAWEKIAYCYKFIYFGLLIPFSFLYFDMLHFNIYKFKIAIILFMLGIPFIVSFLIQTRLVYFNLVEGCTRKMNVFSDSVYRTKRKYLVYLMSLFILPIFGIVFLFFLLYIPYSCFEVYYRLIKDIYYAIKNKKNKSPSKKNKLILYKYMSSEGWFEKNQDKYLNGCLYFANREDLNDPLENTTIAERTASMSEDDSYDPLEKYKICSMTSSPNNFAMWTHYANQHTGVCIEYEIDMNILSQQNIRLEKVLYTSRLPIINDLVYPYDFKKNELKWADVQILLLYKLKNWEYEDEWRMVKESMVAEMNKIGKATRILCGYKATEEYINELKNSVDIVVEKVSLERTERGIYLYVSDDADKSYGEYSNSDWKYNIGDKGVTIINYKGNQDDVQIPTNIRGKPVIEIGESSFKDNDKISSVYIPDTVLKINHHAFSGCYSLRIVAFGDNIQSIEKEAFADCSNIVSIHLPDTVTRIGNDAFRSCLYLKEVRIPSSIKHIGYNVFDGCSSQLKTIYY